MSAPISLIIDVQYSQVAGILKSLSTALNADWVTASATAMILRRTRARFLQELDPDGKPWIPSWAGIKRRAGGHTYRNGNAYTGTGTLFESGALFHSIQVPEGQEEFSPGFQGDLFSTLSERKIMAGAIGEDGEEYGHKFQYGEDEMIQRRFLGINAEDVELFEADLLARAAEAMGL